MATPREAAAVIAAIGLAYPSRFKIGKEQLAPTVTLWHGLLADLPDGAALDACRALLASGQHPPAISEIRAEALSVRLGLGRPSAGDAWGEVVKAFGSNPIDQAPAWSSPAIERALRAIGGWRHACTSDNPAADRARFMENYKETIARAEHLVLTGRAEGVDEALELDAPRGTQELPPAVAELVGKVAGR